LNGDVVAMEGGVAIAGLHGAADAEVEGETEDRDFVGDLADGVVGGAVVDDENVITGDETAKTADKLADGLALVEGGDDDEAAEIYRGGGFDIWRGSGEGDGWRGTI
jgi:hypothetical protein